MTYKIRRTAILDGDIIAYTAAVWAESRQVDDEGLAERVIHEANRWMREAMAEKMVIAFSCSRADNFRRAVWPEYKSHRDAKPTPTCLPHALAVMKQTFSCITIPHLEADDILGMLGSVATLKDGSVPVMVTIDKDLRQVPGWHYNPDKEDHPVRVTQEEGDRFFHRQWLMGDATDSIPGLWKWGPAKADHLLEGTSGSDLTATVMDAYSSHPKGYPLEYAHQMAQCVRILRAGDYDRSTGAIALWYPSGYPSWRNAPAPVVDPVKIKPTETTLEATSEAPKEAPTKVPKSPRKRKPTRTKA